MNKGWEVKKIKDICDKASSNIQQNKLEGISGDYPIFGASGLIKKVDFYQYDHPYIGVVKDGSVGKVSIYPAYSSITGTLQYILPKDGYDGRFVYYALLSIDLAKFKTGTAIPHIYFRDYGEQEISVPSLKEQERIVSILDAVFEKIDLLKRKAEKNFLNSQALFQRVVEKTFEESRGKYNHRIEDYAKVLSGYAFKSEQFKTEGKYQVIRLGNIKQNHLRKESSPVFVDDVDTSILDKALLHKGDVVITQTGTKNKRDYGFAAIVDEDNLLLNQRNACIRFSSELDAKYILYYTYTQQYKKDFFAKEGGTVGQGNVGIRAIKELEVPYPKTEKEQQDIVNRLDNLYKLCANIAKNFKKTIFDCSALKKAILRKAFKGEL